MNSPNRVSWPMYAIDRDAVKLFWVGLREAMQGAGLSDTPMDLTWPDDLTSHWLDPALLLSQTCGYPFVTDLQGRVRYVATPRFSVAGCEGATYRSAIVVRNDEQAGAFPDLVGRRVAFNSRDSQSGYNVLRFVAAPHARAGRFFSASVETGSHRGSLAAVRQNRADVAAIDPVTLAHVAAAFPAELDGLRVLEHTPPSAGLPLVTSLSTNDRRLAALRRALVAACAPERPAARRLMLNGVEFCEEAAYRSIGDMQTRAERLGYHRLD